MVVGAGGWEACPLFTTCWEASGSAMFTPLGGRYRELPCHLSVKWGNLILEETHGASRAGRGPCSSVTSRRAGGDPVRVWVSACGPPRPRVSGGCYLLACVFAHHHAVI